MLNMIPSLPKIKAIYGLTYIQACADCRERERERERERYYNTKSNFLFIVIERHI